MAPSNSILKEVGLKETYLIHNNMDDVDFWDNFQLASKKLNYLPEPKDLMIAFFKAFPKSFLILLHTREFIAKRLKLKTAPESDKKSRMEKLHAFQGNIGERVAIFEVLDKTEIELLTGQKDTHLDFKLSFISYKTNGITYLELATTVILNNRLGKAYFFIVKPFHKFYLKIILKRMENILIHKDW
ncbi:DUF2867 domain-containing protein [Aureispira anguillae]|uniref:DUF2867 domain-containing protein n=1 Tax=Aureispira anguillae TaxID=2864201 RepID=A0A916DV35_9BACT|nr:DUF2867 domain-containing protein [Aureispira anguillae]BDS13120.1 DUF2867 domain-containing protein [Aureispira anguillae]